MIPAHAQQTLDDIQAIRRRLDEAEAAIRAVYGGQLETPPEAIETTELREPRAVKPRRPKPTPAAEPPAPAPLAKIQGVRSAEVKQSQMGGKYDEGILRALRTEAAAYGLSLSDVTRTFTGPGKPAEVTRLVGTIHSAMQSLQRRGLVRKDGRMWHVVRVAATG